MVLSTETEAAVRTLLDGADMLIIGAGLSGTLLADLYARMWDKRVVILERREHIAGNCYDYIERETGILCNLYGPHFFHTKLERVRKYLLRFGQWTPYEHRVIADVDGKLVPVPVNIDTAHTLFPDTPTMHSREEMTAWLANVQKKVANPANSEEAAKARVGDVLYEKIFEPYTIKQWGRTPAQLSAAVLNRIPVRNNWDDRYFPEDAYQMMPKYGFTKWFEEALLHPNIRVVKNADFFDLRTRGFFQERQYEKVFYTGPIDHYFGDAGLARLEYRSLRFIKKNIMATGSEAVLQPLVQVNFPQYRSGNYTRITEYKHLLDQPSPHSSIFEEYSDDTGEPFYPVPDKKNADLFLEYQKMSQAIQSTTNIYFVGRLANYKYFNMDAAIDNALVLYESLTGPVAKFLDDTYSVARLESPVQVALVLQWVDEDLAWVGDHFARILAQFKEQKLALHIYNNGGDSAKLQQQIDTVVSKAKAHGVTVTLRVVILPKAHKDATSSAGFLYHLLYRSEAIAVVNVFMHAKSSAVPLTKVEGYFEKVFAPESKILARPFAHDWVDAEIISYSAPGSGTNNTAGPGLTAALTDKEPVWCAATEPDCVFPPTEPNTEQYYKELLEIFRLNPRAPGFQKNEFRSVNGVAFKGEFVAVDAALRRAVTRHRDRLLQYYQSLTAAEPDPVRAYLLERQWVALVAGAY